MSALLTPEELVHLKIERGGSCPLAAAVDRLVARIEKLEALHEAVKAERVYRDGMLAAMQYEANTGKRAHALAKMKEHEGSVAAVSAALSALETSDGR